MLQDLIELRRAYLHNHLFGLQLNVPLLLLLKQLVLTLSLSLFTVRLHLARKSYIPLISIR